MNPTTETGSQGFVDLGFTPDGALLPETMRVWQFSLTPLKVEGVGPTGMNGVGGWGWGAGSGWGRDAGVEAVSQRMSRQGPCWDCEAFLTASGSLVETVRLASKDLLSPLCLHGRAHAVGVSPPPAPMMIQSSFPAPCSNSPVLFDRPPTSGLRGIPPRACTSHAFACTPLSSPPCSHSLLSLDRPPPARPLPRTTRHPCPVPVRVAHVLVRHAYLTNLIPFDRPLPARSCTRFTLLRPARHPRPVSVRRAHVPVRPLAPPLPRQHPGRQATQRCRQ